MKLNDLLTDAEKDILKKAKATADDMVTMTEKLSTADMPFNEHKEKAKEQQVWFNKIIDLFEIV